LEGHDAVVDGYFFCQEVGADSGFVGGRELFVDLKGEMELAWVLRRVWFAAETYILVHQTRLAYAAVAKDDNLMGVSGVS
jgi:hypothetical protein